MALVSVVLLLLCLLPRSTAAEVKCPPGTGSMGGKCLPCPPGTFNDEFVDKEEVDACKPCKSGHFGSSRGQRTEECQGTCDEGHFCVEGSKRPKANKCGDASVYCPRGSSQPIEVLKGYYSIGGEGETTRVDQKPCEPGHYCIDGIKYECEAGFYNPDSGSSSIDDCIETPMGFYSGKAARAPTKCKAGKFGNSTMLTEPDCSGDCAPGYFCDEETVNIRQDMQECPQGRIGRKKGLTSSSCSEICDPKSGYCVDEASISPAGYFAPNATSEPQKCGDASVYCPRGSASPIQVDPGYYSIGGADETTRIDQKPCEPGFWCNEGIKYECEEGFFGSANRTLEEMSRSTCSGPCSAGFYCQRGSPSPIQHRCGPNAFCGEGSSLPTNISTGFYGVHGDFTTRHDQEECPKFHYCKDGMKLLCPPGTFAGDVVGQSSSNCAGLCPKGFYCVGGQKFACPAGTFGNVEGLKDPLCSGVCEACPEGSISKMNQHLCDPVQIDSTIPVGAESSTMYGDANGDIGRVVEQNLYCNEG